MSATLARSPDAIEKKMQKVFADGVTDPQGAKIRWIEGKGWKMRSPFPVRVGDLMGVARGVNGNIWCVEFEPFTQDWLANTDVPLVYRRAYVHHQGDREQA